MATEDRNNALATDAPLAPITSQLKVRSDLESSITKPYMPRALVAVDSDHPNGTRGHHHQGLTVLQQHVAFFDVDKNGIIYPWETYAGLRAIGFNFIASAVIALIFNALMSYPSLPGWIPSPFLPKYIANIHKNKHGSDSSIYDTEGRFTPANLENMFSKYSQTVPEKLTLGELWSMTEGNREAYDFFGWIFSKVKWALLYVMASDDEGFLSKEAIRRCFDGSLFEYYSQMQMETEKKME